MIILKMYMTLLTPIIAGIINSIFCSKVKAFDFLKKPIDGNKNFLDKKRIFGDNKTWKGLFGYIFFNTIICVLLGMLFNTLKWNDLNFFYINHPNTIKYNLLINNIFSSFLAHRHCPQLLFDFDLNYYLYLYPF